ncbi:MAG TPA: Ldh family oxidoreductase [Stellaceae bacterium]|nr:Ldh family oxidoreductase [Stellaceae bacterium]
MSGRVHLSVAEARALGEAACRGLGYDAGEARIITDHVIDAALCGYEYSGLAKILNLPEHPRFKLPRRPVSVLRETDISTLFDGGNNVGMLALHRAADAAITKALRAGVALIGVTNSWVSGRSAYYVERIARAGLVALHTASSSRMVAPLGGLRPILGTNPIAFALPAAHDVVVFDMGTSAFMMTELMLRERLGQELPEGVAIDRAGNPTRDPAEARRGALLPFGGHKGYGLALMVQALGVVAGSALDVDRDNGYLFIAFKPDLLRPLDEFKREMTELIERVKATPRPPGAPEIRIPSENAFRHRAKALRDGLDIDASVYEALQRLGGSARQT